MSSYKKRKTSDNIDTIECNSITVRQTSLSANNDAVYNVALPSKNGTLATLSDVTGSVTGVVDVGSAQTITGVKTFSTPFVLPTGVITVGASSVSMVATSGQLINANSNQTIGGIKTFSVAPICNAAGVGTFTYLNSTQSLTNKTLNSNNCSWTNGTNSFSCRNLNNTPGNSFTLSVNPSVAQTLTLPNATDQVVCRNTTDTLTNKTFSGNTMFPNTSAVDSFGSWVFTGGTSCLNSSGQYMLGRVYKGSSTASAGAISFQLSTNLGTTFGSNAGTYMVTMTLQSGDFGLDRGAYCAIIELSTWGGGRVTLLTTLYSFNTTFVSLSATGLLSLTVSQQTSAIYEFSQMQICY